jgi:hypothetical protein
MTKMFLFLFIACGIGSFAYGAKYITIVGSKLNADYKAVTSETGEVSNTVGDIELIGFGGGLTTQAPGAFGTNLELLFLGTNGQKLTPPPRWGVPWYFRASGKGNYTFSFGLYFEIGGDVIGTFHQDGESHYLGLGVNAGMGYRFSEQIRVCVAMENSSILFAVDNGRYLRGHLVQLIYVF